MNNQNEYILGLNIVDTFTIYGYTFHGDVWVNSFLRGSFETNKFIHQLQTYDKYINENFFPFFFECNEFLQDMDTSVGFNMITSVNCYTKVVDNKLGNQLNGNATLHNILTDIKRLYKNFEKSNNKSMVYVQMLTILQFFNGHFWNIIIKKYIKRLNTIILTAPSLKQKMIVFRGVENDFYFEGNDKKIFFKNKGFISTSLDYVKARGFAKGGPIKKITLLPGSKCLFITPVSKYRFEIEVLLPSTTTYLIRSHVKKPDMIPKLTGLVSDICKKGPPMQRYITDIVAV